VHALAEVRFSADGTTLWVSGIDGVFRAEGALTDFEQLPGPLRISLAVENDGALWLCGFYDGMHDGIGSVEPDGTVERVLVFSDVDAPVACGDAAPSSLACESLWRDWQREILDVRPDAGAPPPPPSSTDAGAGSDGGQDQRPPTQATTASRPKDSGCSRARVGDGGNSGHVVLALLALLAARRRACRRRRVFAVA
jgi:hypothetical protein